MKIRNRLGICFVLGGIVFSCLGLIIIREGEWMPIAGRVDDVKIGGVKSRHYQEGYLCFNCDEHYPVEDLREIES